MHIQEIDTIIKDRARPLERQSSIYGLNTPPETTLQLEQLRKVRIAVQKLTKQHAEHGAIDKDLFDRFINTLLGLGISLTSVEFGDYKDNRL